MSNRHKTAQDEEATESRQTPPSRRRPTQKTSSSSSTTRVLPYPLRTRTPPQTTFTPVASDSRLPRVSLDSSPNGADQAILHLVVYGILKSTVGQRGNTERKLGVFAANGASFDGIMHQLWEKFSGNIKVRATLVNDTWSVETPTEASWNSVIQFKVTGRIVPAAKSPHLLNKWVATQRNSTVNLTIYEDGQQIANARMLDEFLQACIRPQPTDPSGAAAESLLRDMVKQLQAIWGNTYQASAVTWRMWANEIMRNLDRPTWERAVLDAPPNRLERYLSPVDGQVHEHLTHLTRSTQVALDTINFALADNAELKRDWEAFGRRLECQRRALEARKETLEGFLNDIPLPTAAEVHDPLPTMPNIEDTEHQE
ncbi:unnamed protein product [Phytophthora fragariaefolia]|uniref:Unnamed protein product n=1 Tax=Phytophthora fragariaefolia TaxID=1490495 RepID=A0A9W6XLU2_9STRA|nr:unnamed protein product [Phytophthora fragariaefolia]